MIRFRHRAEHAALRAAAALFRGLPYRAALVAAWWIAALSHFVIRFRRAEAIRRIRLVLGPSASDRSVRRIAWVSWRNLCFNVAELARLPKLRPHWIERHMDAEEMRRTCRVPAEGEGAILAVPHAGNWDLSGIALHLLGAPMFFLARRQRNPLTDAYLNRLRGVTGIETVLTDSGLLRGVLRRLKQGRYLAMLPDVRARTPALDVPFLGGSANLGTGMALFARRTGTPILPCFLSRDGWTRHRLRRFVPVRPDPELPQDEDILRMTREVMACFDAAIRAEPEQYFWYNKRWVLDPMPCDPPCDPARQSGPGVLPTAPG